MKLCITYVIRCSLFLQILNKIQSQDLDDFASDTDFGGELTEDDFRNANDPQYSHKAIGAEFNNDTENLFEGDIIKDVNNADYDYNYFDDVTTSLDAKWPKSNNTVIIPYTFPSLVSPQDKADIAHAISEFHEKTCIRFQKRQDELDWIHINTRRWGCRSYVGRKRGQQVITAGACLDPRTGGSWGKLLHEFMHAIGFVHEHTRPDRDDWVTIIRENIMVCTIYSSISFYPNYKKYKV